jgi:farnesyl-diphosphate farnesyltransferase
LPTLSPADLQLTRSVLDTIASGQALDLQRFDGASAQRIIALRTAAELDDYTYRVAGCVGGFWTKLCRAHVFPHALLHDAQLLTDGIRFGKGLQLVNILRDLPADLRNGRCYLPADELAQLGLTPTDLLDAANEKKLRPLYNTWLDRADEHLAAGWAYTNTLPWRCARVRLACAWPVLLGQQTLAQLRTRNILDATQRVKVSRSDVKFTVFKTLALYPLPHAWRRLGRA